MKKTKNVETAIGSINLFKKTTSQVFPLTLNVGLIEANERANKEICADKKFRLSTKVHENILTVVTKFESNVL